MKQQIILLMNPIVTLTLQADLRYLRIASVMACNVAEIFADVSCTAGNVAEFCHAYELSVSEAFTNSVRYAEPSQPENQVTIRFWADNGTLVANIIDKNPQFNPETQAPDIDSYPEGGYGLFLIHRLMDTVSYIRKDDTNMLTMTKRAIMTHAPNT
jgi:serine/threonine-protein kinase RsbW